jgi:hypothetical protein
MQLQSTKEERCSLLILIVVVQAVFDGLRVAHVIDWSPWFGLMPVYLGVPAWAAWTRLKIWAARRVQAMQESGDDVLEDY